MNFAVVTMSWLRACLGDAARQAPQHEEDDRGWHAGWA
jgi:hypothetical protein